MSNQKRQYKIPIMFITKLLLLVVRLVTIIHTLKMANKVAIAVIGSNNKPKPNEPPPLTIISKLKGIK